MLKQNAYQVYIRRKYFNSIASPRCARVFRFSLQTAVDCERAFLAALDGNCKTPIAGQVTDRLARVFSRFAMALVRLWNESCAASVTGGIVAGDASPAALAKRGRRVGCRVRGRTKPCRSLLDLTPAPAREMELLCRAPQYALTIAAVSAPCLRFSPRVFKTIETAVGQSRESIPLCRDGQQCPGLPSAAVRCEAHEGWESGGGSDFCRGVERKEFPVSQWLCFFCDKTTL